LLVMLATHGTSSVLMRLVSVLGPELILNYGWTRELVGWTATAVNVGSVGFVLFGAGVLKALGSTRAIRAGLLVGIAGLALLALPVSWLVIVAGLLLGLAHAPANPAGNELLERYAPPGSRALIFSLKQSAPPLGGVFAGLTLPWVTVHHGLVAALCFCGVIVFGALLATRPLHRRHATPMSRAAWKDSLSLVNIGGPARIVLGSPQMRRLAIAGFALAMVQSIWVVYLPSYLVLGLGYHVTTAGLLFAAVQGASIAGRILLGWSADNLAPASAILLGALLASALMTAALAAAGAFGLDVLFVAVLACAGVATAGWNGVQIAEVIRTAGQERTFEAVSGMMLVIGSGIIAGPPLFSLLLGWLGDWELTFLAAAMIPLAGFVVVFALSIKARRKPPPE
jgi:MFS family permease